MIKQIYVLAILLVFPFIGCGDGKGNGSGTDGSSAPTVVPSEGSDGSVSGAGGTMLGVGGVDVGDMIDSVGSPDVLTTSDAAVLPDSPVALDAQVDTSIDVRAEYVPLDAAVAVDSRRAIDTAVSSDAGSLAALCSATGGYVETNAWCCSFLSDFPDTCSMNLGYDGCDLECSNSSSKYITRCVCSVYRGVCFSPTQGCMAHPL